MGADPGVFDHVALDEDPDGVFEFEAVLHGVARDGLPCGVLRQEVPRDGHVGDVDTVRHRRRRTAEEHRLREPLEVVVVELDRARARPGRECLDLRAGRQSADDIGVHQGHGGRVANDRVNDGAPVGVHVAAIDDDVILNLGEGPRRIPVGIVAEDDQFTL